MSDRFRNYTFFILILAVFFFLVPFRTDNHLDLDVGADSFTVSGPEQFSYTMQFDQIESMELTTLTDKGDTVTGSENKNYSWGFWENEAWGKYILCASKKTDVVVMAKTYEGTILVFNFETESATQEMYNSFMDLFESRAEKQRNG